MIAFIKATGTRGRRLRLAGVSICNRTAAGQADVECQANEVRNKKSRRRMFLYLCNSYLFIYSISFNVIQPMWLCRQSQTHKIADMSKRKKQANKQKEAKQHT
jgi:hypothetical protein